MGVAIPVIRAVGVVIHVIEAKLIVVDVVVDACPVTDPKRATVNKVSGDSQAKLARHTRTSNGVNRNKLDLCMHLSERHSIVCKWKFNTSRQKTRRPVGNEGGCES